MGFDKFGKLTTGRISIVSSRLRSAYILHGICSFIRVLDAMMIRVDGNTIKQVDSFVYLGGTVCKYRGSRKEVTNRSGRSV